MRIYILLLVFLSIQLSAMDKVGVNPNDAVIAIPQRRIVHAKRRFPKESVTNASFIDDQTWNRMTSNEKLEYYLVCFGMKKNTVFYSMTLSCACAAIGFWICVQLRNMI